MPGTLRADVRAFIAAQLAATTFVPHCDAWLSGWDEGFSRRLAESDAAPPDWRRKLAAFDEDEDGFGRGETAPDQPKPPSDGYQGHDPGQYQ